MCKLFMTFVLREHSYLIITVCLLNTSPFFISKFNLFILYPYCLVLVCSRNGFKHDFTIELKSIEGLMED